MSGSMEPWSIWHFTKLTVHLLNLSLQCRITGTRSKPAWMDNCQAPGLAAASAEVNRSDIQKADNRWYRISLFLFLHIWMILCPSFSEQDIIWIPYYPLGGWALSEWRGNSTIIQTRSMTHVKKAFKIASKRIPQSTPVTIQWALSISVALMIWWSDLCRARGNDPYKHLQHHKGNCVVCPMSSFSEDILCWHMGHQWLHGHDSIHQQLLLNIYLRYMWTSRSLFPWPKG